MSNIFDIFKSIEKETAVLKTGAPEKLVVFLGNPGSEYSRTRHNAGFMLSEYISEKHGIKMDRLRFKALTGEAMYGGVKTLFIKPQTYMNNSGESVIEAVSFYKLDPEKDMIVVYDDMYLEPGRLRIRAKGSDGGHNGIKSIIRVLSSDAFWRIRVGVGAPPKGYSLPDWVLGVIPEKDRTLFFECLERAEKALALLVSGKNNEAMNKYNS